MNLITTDKFCKKEYGEKLYRLSFNAHMGCPNRGGPVLAVGGKRVAAGSDVAAGTAGSASAAEVDVVAAARAAGRGCIFCSEGGSGEFAVDITNDIDHDMKLAIDKVSSKFKGSRYIAYFQAYTNTYAPVEELRKLYTGFIERDEIAVLAIATRPDCLDEEKYALLEELNRIKPVWVELGLQTVKEESVRYIRRGYDNEVYDSAVKRLYSMGIHTITHVILYLPGESVDDMKATVRHITEVYEDCCANRELRSGPSDKSDGNEETSQSCTRVDLTDGNKAYGILPVWEPSAGIKFSLLNVLKGTDLAAEYERTPFFLPTLEEYAQTLKECLELLPADMVVHRLCSDPPKKLLIEPKWAADKKRVMNTINDLISPPEDYYVYIIRCNDGTLYTGVAKDVDKRFKEHTKGRGARYTRAHHPEEIVYTEKLRGKGRALKREYEIKQLPREKKLELIKRKSH